MQWLRRRFLAGLFVTLPVIASVAALVWIFRVIDGFTSPIYARQQYVETALPVPAAFD